MDEAAFSSYVATRRTQLLRTACLLCGDPHRAEDIVQDALARLYGAWDRASRRRVAFRSASDDPGREMERWPMKREKEPRCRRPVAAMSRRLRPDVPGTLTLLAAMLLAGCGGDPDPSVAPEPTASTTSVMPSETVTSPSPTGVVPLEDGYLDPGRYSFVVSVDCEGVKDDPIACPEGVADPPPIPLEVTVPDGWEHPAGFPVIWTIGKQTQEEGALVLGWTSNTVGVQSDPCSSESHELPDVKVGPSVDDFVDAVVSQDWFHGTAPVDTKVGGASGRYFTLKGPADLSECVEWRPWDPGFYAQGPSNLWEVWVLDVEGHRVLIVADYFPGTSARTITQLRQMVRSIRFTSSS